MKNSLIWKKERKQKSGEERMLIYITFTLGLHKSADGGMNQKKGVLRFNVNEIRE